MGTGSVFDLVFLFLKLLQLGMITYIRASKILVPLKMIASVQRPEKKSFTKFKNTFHKLETHLTFFPECNVE